MSRSLRGKILSVGLSLLFSASGTLSAQDGMLQTKDVALIMKQIFQQHVETKSINADLMRNAFKVYIEQADPDRIYLLQPEVDRFTNMSNREMQDTIDQYQKGNYSGFHELNATIQQAIQRSRSYRAQLEANPMDLFQQARGYKINRPDDSFAKDIYDLQNRTKNQILGFLVIEKERYGESRIMRDPQRTLGMFEDDMRDNENSYLYQDDAGEPMTAEQKENLFALHVLKSLAKSLDSHTSFFNPAEAHDMRVRLEKGFDGIGITVFKSPQGLVVDKILPKSPASLNKQIEEGDHILEINGKKALSLTEDQVENLIYADKGQSVKLDLKRKNVRDPSLPSAYSINLVSAPIEIDEGRAQSFSERFQNGLIGVITLTSFYKGENGISSEEDVSAAIKKLQKQGDLRGLILDLRENSGGFLTQAVKVAGLFITNGIIVISKYSNGDEKFYRDMDGKTSFKGPLIILTSRATASAAEIVSQALQDYGVALIVGDEHTYGKGTIQSQTVTENNAVSHFKVTVGKYYTVSGKTPQLKGVKADIVVPSHYANETNFGEEYLDHALTSDAITPSYQDQLTDIDPDLKPWYLKYYLPSLQKKDAEWIQYLPRLKQRSQERLAKNQEEYRRFINHNQSGGERDIQMEEAINILEDMAILESHKHDKPKSKAPVAENKSQ